MTSYIIAMVNVRDQEVYSNYTKLTPDIVRKYGGEFLVRQISVEALEGPDFDRRLVVLRFPSSEDARKFYHSKEYQEARKLRIDCSSAQFLLAEGS